MKLIAGKIRKLEAAAAAAEARSLEVSGIVWSAHEVVVDPEQLERGESIATDCYVDAWPADQFAPVQWRTVDRITRDPEDLGAVYGPDGKLCGVVTYRANHLVRVEWISGPRAEASGA